MKIPIAFGACVKIDEHTFYIMGGFEDYSTKDVIQSFNFTKNEWSLLSIKLPVKLAKIGGFKLSDKEILICGGIYEDMKQKS